MNSDNVSMFGNTSARSFDGKLLHAYLVWGPEGSGKHAYAQSLAAAMVCAGTGEKPCQDCAHCRKAQRGIHPDITVIDREPDKREILVDQIRAIVSDSVIMPNEAEKKVYLIQNADFLNEKAQNAMLKVLEEPPSHASFILIAENPAALLQTVRSRCVEISLVPGFAQADGDDTEREFLEGLLSGDDVAFLRQLFSLEKQSKKDMSLFIAALKRVAQQKLRDSLYDDAQTQTRQWIIHLIEVLVTAEDYLDCNVSSGHIVGLMCAELLDRK